eukprot:TRINITY_DN3917_c0_g1_i1.p1 TRINITY_DN3917_c0_g1~~TRINITY_DN3917_c0_g1_i1.p1  ORF type:complete len:608 (+),score=135.35 TRINITY_DN3917_c0_g1_i1:107-1930(+)
MAETWKKQKVSEQTGLLLKHITESPTDVSFVRSFTSHHASRQEGKYSNIDLMISVMEKLFEFKEDPSKEELTADYLLLLRVLARDPANATAALEANVIGLIVSIMKLFPNSTQVLPLTCTCFVNLVTSPRAVTQARRKGAIAASVKVLSSHYSNEVVTEACIRGLINLTHSEENGREATKQGLIPVLAYVAVTYQDNERIQSAVLGIMSFLPIATDRSTSPHLFYIGKQIKKVLDRFPDSIEIQQSGCRCLYRLFNIHNPDSELKINLVKENISETIHKAISRYHAHSEGVLSEAVRLLGLLADDCPDAQVGEVASGSIEMIFKCMQENIDLFMFQAEAFTALSSLIESHDSDLQQEYKERAQKSNVLDTTIQIMKEHPSEDIIQNNACQFINILFDAETDQEKLQWVEKGLIDILVRAMNEHYFDAELQQAVLSVFAQLFIENSKTQKEAIEAGAVEAILSLIRCHPDSKQTLFLACTILANICLSDPKIQERAAELDAIPQLLEVLNNSNSAEVAEASCFALGNILQGSLGVKIKAMQMGAVQAIVNLSRRFLNEKTVLSRSVPAFQCLLHCRPDVHAAIMAELNKAHKGELVYDILLANISTKA